MTVLAIIIPINARIKKVKDLLAYQHEHYYGKRYNIHTYVAPLSALVSNVTVESIDSYC